MTKILFSGEGSLALKLTAQVPGWDCQIAAVKLEYDQTTNRLFRSNRPREYIESLIYYADADDKLLEEHNHLEIIKWRSRNWNSVKPLSIEQAHINNGPSWPNPAILADMLNRHEVLKQCVENGFVTHPVFIDTVKNITKVDFNASTYVIKVGLQHRGINKYRLEDLYNLPLIYEGKLSESDEITIEPFFKGRSVRVLITGDRVEGLETINNDSWIKNSPGGDTIPYQASRSMRLHAEACAESFALDVAGVDYIVESNGCFHFLEINQYPALACSQYGEQYLKDKMLSL